MTTVTEGKKEKSMTINLPLKMQWALIKVQDEQFKRLMGSLMIF